MGNLKAVFDPQSIAIFGASSDLRKISGRPLRYLLEFGYKGNIYPINPKYTELAGIKCYPDLAAVGEPIDMVLVGVAASAVPAALSHCAAAGVKVAVIFSSGFAETGAEGKELQRQVSEICQNTGLRVVGPNCLGVVNLQHRVTGTFSSLLERVKEDVPGSIGFITQSGAFGSMIFAVARDMGSSFRYFVNTGNEADVDLGECLSHMVDSQDINVIGAYCEGVRHGQRFLEAADQALAARKPVTILKVGRSSVGTSAAASHTGSMVGSDRVYDAIFKQKGIARANDIEELLDILCIASLGRIPAGNNVGVVTISGGAGILIADKCEELCLEVPELADDTKEKLKTVLPKFGSAMNPVDTTAELINKPELLEQCLQIMLSDDHVDTLIIFLGLFDHISNELIEIIERVHMTTHKLLVVSWTAAAPGAIKKLIKKGIPAYEDPTRATKATAAMVNFRHAFDRYSSLGTVTKSKDLVTVERRDAAKNYVAELVSQGATRLSEYESKQIFKFYEIPVTKGELVESVDEALKIAAEVNFPVVLKVESPDIVHKTEAGVVRLGIKDPVELKKAYVEIMENALAYNASARIKGVFVQEMLTEGTETIVGVTNDAVFGPSIMFGLGGIFVEVLKDVAIRVTPLNELDAREMVSEIKGASILQGVRGKTPRDVNAVVDVLLRISLLSQDLASNLAELDVNPLFIFEDGKGAKAADALIVLK